MLSLSLTSVCFESSCMRFSRVGRDFAKRERDGKKEIHDVRLDFLATAEKGATPFQETNRPAFVRLYIFRCSSKPPFDKSRLSTHAAAVPFSNIILLQIPGMQALQRRCSARVGL